MPMAPKAEKKAPREFFVHAIALSPSLATAHIGTSHPHAEMIVVSSSPCRGLCSLQQIQPRKQEVNLD